MLLSTKLKNVLFGDRSTKLKWEKNGRNFSFGYTKGLNERELFEFPLQDGLIVTLVERIKKLESRIELLESKKK